MSYRLSRKPKGTSCRSCGAHVLWMSAGGAPMPVNFESVDVDNLEAVDELGLTPLFDRERGHVSHFATCPQAAEWRRRR